FKNDFLKRSTWKIVGFRVDPSAPGTAPQLIAVFGSLPQIRLIAQPVTVDPKGNPRVHDYTAHLVFNYAAEIRPPAIPGGPPVFVPDKAKFAEIVADIRDIKLFLKDK